MKSTWELHKFSYNRVRKFYIFIITLYIFGVAWLSLNLTYGNVFHLSCPWKKITGIPCPACGLTTGTMETIHGNYIDGFELHPFSFIVALLFLIIPIWLIVDLIIGKKSFHNAFLSFELLIKRNTLIKVILILILLTIWIKNILSF